MEDPASQSTYLVCFGSGSTCFWASRIRIHCQMYGSGSGSTSQRYGSGSGNFYHQAKIVRKYHSVCPLVRIGPPTPLSCKRMSPPPTKRGGNTRLRVRGWGSQNSEEWRKNLALCLLCAQHYVSSTSLQKPHFVDPDPKPRSKK